MLLKLASCRTLGSCARNTRCLVSVHGEDIHDLVVIGGGVMGVWTAIMAARRGASTVLAEQFDVDHGMGSSHGDGRIYRLAYADDVYFDMMMHSLPLWRELQASTTNKVIATTGHLSLAPKNHPRLFSLEELYQRRGAPYERLSSNELRERFPQYGVSDRSEALFQADGGVLFASSAMRAAWQLAESLGVKTITGFRAMAVKEEASHVVVTSEDGTTLRGKGIVMAPGAWLSKLAHLFFGMKVSTRVSAEEVSYHAPKESSGIDHSYHSMPTFSAFFDNGLGPQGYYGLPMIDVPGIKVSAHYCGPSVDPDARPRSAGGISVAQHPDEEKAAKTRVNAVIESNSQLVRDIFPHVEHSPFRSQSCLYTSTPDHDYVIDKVPGLARIVLAGGGSGHAFKMGPAIGDCCAALALEKPVPLSIDRFSIDRDALRKEYREDEAMRH